MKPQLIVAIVMSLVPLPGLAQEPGGASAPADARARALCVAIDETRDTLAPQDRSAALLLMRRQFEVEGATVVSGPAGCDTYTLSHIRLGRTIVVTLSGPGGSRQGTALGLDDLPPLYSQMARSIVTGRPMTGLNVVDRTNATEVQASPRRVQSDSLRYARLGYGSTVGANRFGGATFGLGYRVELDGYGLDISLLNVQAPSSQTSSSYSYSSTTPFRYGSSATFIRLEVLHFFAPTANATFYAGGGAGLGTSSIRQSDGVTHTDWRGSGLLGALTAGYETGRASTLRMFVQADVELPFYRVLSDSYSYSSKGARTAGSGGSRQYWPSIAVSVGFGWQRNRD